jgi:hypothetical protein
MKSVRKYPVKIEILLKIENRNPQGISGYLYLFVPRSDCFVVPICGGSVRPRSQTAHDNKELCPLFGKDLRNNGNVLFVGEVYQVQCAIFFKQFAQEIGFMRIGFDVFKQSERCG